MPRRGEADDGNAGAAPTQAALAYTQGGAFAATQRDDEGSRRLRMAIRSIRNRAVEDRDDMIDPTSNRLETELARLNDLQAQIHRPREQAEDADAFCLISHRGLEAAQLLAAGGKHRTARQLARLVKDGLAPRDRPDPEGAIAAARAAGRPDPPLEPGDLDWALLAAVAAGLDRPAVGATALLGPLSARPRPRAVPQRAPRAGPAPRFGDGRAEGPTVGSPRGGAGGGGGGGDDNEPAQETDRRMEALYADLAAAAAVAGGPPVSVLEAVLDHGSFATTVENLFALSFLVRDGAVALEGGGRDGGPVTARALPKKRKGTTQAGAAGAAAAGGGSPGDAAAAGPSSAATTTTGRRQLVLSYTAKDYEAWCRAVPPEACLMPRHAELTSGVGGGGGARPAQRARVG